MESYDQGPPRSKTNVIILVVLGVLLAICTCCGGMVFWVYSRGSEFAGEARNLLAEMARINDAVSQRFQAPAQVSPNYNSTNGVTTVRWTVSFMGSQYDALDPTTQQGAAFDVARFAHSVAAPLDPPTEVCVVFSYAQPRCFAGADLAAAGPPPGTAGLAPQGATPPNADAAVAPEPPVAPPEEAPKP